MDAAASAAVAEAAAVKAAGAVVAMAVVAQRVGAVIRAVEMAGARFQPLGVATPYAQVQRESVAELSASDVP